jgi:hypothetical protein
MDESAARLPAPEIFSPPVSASVPASAAGADDAF